MQQHTTAYYPDIVFLVRTPPSLKLAVSSETLSSSSKVFAAMFVPNFKEGQGLGPTKEPKEIALPDDKPAAMFDLCHLVHGKTVDKFFGIAKSGDIFRLVTVADKYGCIDVMQAKIRAVLLANPKCDTTMALARNGRQMLAAYLLNDAEAFTIATYRLIGGVAEPYHNLLAEEWACHVPNPIIYALEARRAESRDLAINGPMRLFKKDYQSVDNSKQYIQQLDKAFGNWPPSFYKTSATTVLQCIKSVNKLKELSYDRPGVFSPTRAQIEILAEEAKKLCWGLCLMCIKEGKQDLVTVCSDKAHSQARSVLLKEWERSSI